MFLSLMESSEESPSGLKFISSGWFRIIFVAGPMIASKNNPMTSEAPRNSKVSMP